MTTPELADHRPLVFVDCPLCDEPANLDIASGTVGCPACGILVELAPDESVRLPAAA